MLHFYSCRLNDALSERNHAAGLVASFFQRFIMIPDASSGLKWNVLPCAVSTNIGLKYFYRMKIFSSQQIRNWDQATISRRYRGSIELMEHAAGEVARYLLENEPALSYVVVCGTGNNGGDGLVIARKLHEEGKSVEVFIAGASDTGTDDFKSNLQRLMNSDIEIHFIPEDLEGFSFPGADRIIDCILGTGTNRAADGYLGAVIRCLNNSAIPVISVDLPSGMLPDLLEPQQGEVVHAWETITFESPKLAMLIPENEIFVGQMTVLPIGLDPDFADHQSADYFFFDDYDAASVLKKRSRSAYKNQFGHLQVIAGSRGKMGAAVLCSHAAMSAGSGLVTASVPACGMDILQIAVPEVMCISDDDANYLHTTEILEKCNAAAIGPGIGTFPETVIMMRKLMRTIHVPAVFDADALNIIAEKRLIGELKPGSVITPHIGEFDRLFGLHHNTFERIRTMREIASVNQIVVVLKGANSMVADPNGVLSFNSSGNPGMATAGSGDVLTGIIGSLLVQGYDPAIAARLGVYVHGLAGDVAREENSSSAMMARDIIQCLGDAFLHIENLRDLTL
jgi:NAD(P)H-hydrate epimerase